MTAALDRALPRVPIVKGAFWLGAIAPDLPLWLLSIGGAVYYHGMMGWTPEQAATRMFDELFFQSPWWIVPHNLLHAPIVLLVGILVVWRSRRNIGSVQRWLFWFLVSCLFHSAIDIFTHVDDGPLIFFPFDWHTRFRSAISYWDDRYYGQIFQPIELALDVMLAGYLLTPVLARWLRRYP